MSQEHHSSRELPDGGLHSSLAPTPVHGRDFYENIVLPSGEFIASDLGNKAKKFNYIPSFIASLYLTIVLLYQIISTYAIVFGKSNQVVVLLTGVFHSLSIWQILFGAALFYILMLLFGPVAHAGIISLIHSQEQDHHQSTTKAFGMGLSRFFELFELHNLVGVFNLLSVVTFYTFLLRLFEFNYVGVITLFIFVYFVLANIANMLFSYAPYHIVFGHKSSFQALSASAIQAITHLDITFRAYMYYLIISVRTIVIGILVLLVPFFLSWLFGFLGLTPDLTMVFILMGVLLVPFVIFLAHMNSVLEIFLIGLWYRAYKLTLPSGSHDQANEHAHH